MSNIVCGRRAKREGKLWDHPPTHEGPDGSEYVSYLGKWYQVYWSEPDCMFYGILVIDRKAIKTFVKKGELH